tara:strand:- start:459 stop:938 length:480 start_codon:yes stop_codon:yes gene_type:complete
MGNEDVFSHFLVNKTTVKRLCETHNTLYVFPLKDKDNHTKKPEILEEKILILDGVVCLGESTVFYIYVSLRAFHEMNKDNVHSELLSKIKLKGLKHSKVIKRMDYIFSEDIKKTIKPSGQRNPSIYVLYDKQKKMTLKDVNSLLNLEIEVYSSKRCLHD